MAHYKVILAYDGTHFQGFQRQGTNRTVQAEVENALRGLNWGGRAILSAGRTDTGVHAAGQVVAFDLEWPHPTEALVKALNAHLPEDVAAKSAEVAEEEFHPRYDAQERCYRYRIYLSPHRDPLRERFAWRVWPIPGLDLLQAAAQRLTGRHDFAAFGNPPRAGGSTERMIFSCGWEAEGDELRFEVRGNAFLYHMVRRMVYVQVQAGQNRLSLEAIDEAILHTRPLPPGLADPQGLVLWEVRYAVEAELTDLRRREWRRRRAAESW
jgi:tRNA pseudouridine38-40 synthase